MPYVNDSRNDSKPVTLYVTSGGGNPVSAGTFPRDIRTANQYGWRSEGELEASQDALNRLQGSSMWKDTFTAIEAMDRIERAMTNPLIRDPYDLVVHDRDYTEQNSYGQVVQSEVGDAGNPFHYADNLFVTYFTNPGSFGKTESEQRTIGGELMRNARPTVPHSNLTQWFGELRQFGDLARVNTRIKPEDLDSPGFRAEVERFRQGGAAAGGAYLAGQFGWVPFIGELMNAIGVVANSEDLLIQYFLDSGKTVRRSRGRNILESVYTYEGTLNGGSAYNSRSFVDPNGVGVQVGWRPAYRSSRLTTKFSSTVVVQDDIRAGATFEYFAADPNGALGRIREYAQKAKLLYGDPLLSYSTLWELAPWSWLVDWHTDIGGFLSFQESVQTDSLAWRRAWSLGERRVDVVTRHFDYHYNTTGTWVGSMPIAFSAADYKWQRRRQGSPYDMGIDYSGYTTQQWYILGSLGLTLAPGIPR